MPELTLESELQRQAQYDPDAKAFWHRYENVKVYLKKEYYPWIQANCPFFTDHGEKHIQSVIQAGSLLLQEHLSSDSKKDVTCLDIFLVLCAIVWHDAGMVYERSEHASRVAGMINKIKAGLLPEPDIQRLIVEIVSAHEGNEGLRTPRKEEDFTMPSQRVCTVYPRALAAIVRFADEVSENWSRISQALLPNVPDENRIYWEYANCIKASRPNPARERVVVTIEIQHDAAIREFTCPQRFLYRANDEGNISLIEYIICRLEKMINERAYCASEFSRYVSIREITARFTILRDLERLENYELGKSFSQSGYPNINVFDNFFECYPSWHPQRLKEALKDE